jgi:DnaK suppressor protein
MVIAFLSSPTPVWRTLILEEKMKQSEIAKYKQMVDNQQSEIESRLMRRDGIAIEHNADPLDEVQHASDRELAIRNLDRESMMLRAIRSALERIKEGNYGTCTSCDEDISPKRLAAVPWSPYCLRCQEITDRKHPVDTEYQLGAVA